MKTAMFTMAVMLSTWPVFFPRGSVQPVNGLGIFTRLNKACMFTRREKLLIPTLLHSLPHPAAQESEEKLIPSILTERGNKRSETGVRKRITDTDGKTAMVFTIKALPLQLSMSVSGRELKRARLTYIHTIF
jgi:hypothetical protein